MKQLEKILQTSFLPPSPILWPWTKLSGSYLLSCSRMLPLAWCLYMDPSGVVLLASGVGVSLGALSWPGSAPWSAAWTDLGLAAQVVRNWPTNLCSCLCLSRSYNSPIRSQLFHETLMRPSHISSFCFLVILVFIGLAVHFGAWFNFPSALSARLGLFPDYFLSCLSKKIACPSRQGLFHVLPSYPFSSFMC